MDYGQSTTRPEGAREGDTWIPLEPHPFAGTVGAGERLVFNGRAWVPETEVARQEAGLHRLPEQAGAAAGPGGLPQIMSPETAETRGIASRLAGTALGEEEAGKTAQEIADWNWAYEEAAKVAEIMKDYGQEADIEALAQKFYNQRHPAETEVTPSPWDVSPTGDGGVAAAPPILSQAEERMLIDLQNAVKVGELDEGQAWKILENYWSEEGTRSRRAEEAGRRGETLLAGTHPGPNLPMTGPGGMGAGLQQKYGLPDLTSGVQGLPGSQALGVFGQAQEQMGLPAQLPPIEPPQFQLPNWQAMGQAMPNFGGTNYFEELLKQGRMTAPGL